MIKLSGVTLRIKKMTGRNGDFCVADLQSDIGEFKVKDALLDQFDDGEYTGTVWISEIYLAQYISFGKGVTEIRARLHDLQLDGARERPHDHEPLEPDPVDEVATAVAPAPAPIAVTAPAPEESRLGKLRERLATVGKKPAPPAPEPVEKRDDSDDREMAVLFGELWLSIEAREPVKLDPTVERSVLRAQSAAIRQLGYSLDPIKQIFMPATA
ncbi:DUF3275 family protein [Acidovorax sp. SUPP950]|uniref:DUF3275 family protein n=1 Tax=Acidovorax sp. SUPP950 TaxID=511901 RepID=UPI0023BCD067|nr:DUF3275 family protein [Acidovorax sp. SUPP950]GKS73301.1 DUF3275 family protein [Acidovorax sp. SUPP950]